MVFSRLNPQMYPTPHQVARRLAFGCAFLAQSGYPVAAIYISAYHPRAADSDIKLVAQRLRNELSVNAAPPATVYTTERARKPNSFMLRVAGATVYYGDSPEDAQAAEAAGIPFVAVPRFM